VLNQLLFRKKALHRPSPAGAKSASVSSRKAKNSEHRSMP
jgi:hypothetical protein